MSEVHWDEVDEVIRRILPREFDDTQAVARASTLRGTFEHVVNEASLVLPDDESTQGRLAARVFLAWLRFFPVEDRRRDRRVVLAKSYFVDRGQVFRDALARELEVLNERRDDR